MAHMTVVRKFLRSAPVHRVTVVGLPYGDYQKIAETLTAAEEITLKYVDENSPIKVLASALPAGANVLGVLTRDDAKALRDAFGMRPHGIDGLVGFLLEDDFAEGRRALAAIIELPAGIDVAGAETEGEREGEVAGEEVPSWTTNDGRRIPISKMGDNHLMSVIRYLKGEVPRFREDMEAAAHKNADIEEWSEALVKLGSCSNLDFLQTFHPTWPHLISEARARGFDVSDHV